MVGVYVIPNWFFGYSIALGLFFALVNGLVAYYAFKISRLTSHRIPGLFGWGFSLIGASYLMWSLLNLSLFSGLNDSLDELLRVTGLNLLYTIEAYIHLILFLSGLIVLTYMTLRVENRRTLVLLFLLVLLSLVFAANTLYIFYSASSVLLAYIIWHYALNYWRRRTTRNLISLLAFIFLFLSTFNLAFALQSGVFYINGHMFGLLAYVLILFNLVWVLRDAKKKG